MTATASTTAPTAPSASARAYLSRIERADLARIALVGAGVLGVQRRAAPAGRQVCRGLERDDGVPRVRQR